MDFSSLGWEDVGTLAKYLLILLVIYFGICIYLGLSIWGNLIAIGQVAGALAGFYLVLQKIHMRLQMRFLKNISDEIIKINDFCIEFSFKYSQYNDGKSLSSDGKEKDLKTLTEVQTIRSKIKNHLDYLSAQINAFPFGNPLNFFVYSISGKYLWETTQVKTDELLTTYQDTILNDTILQLEIPIDEDDINQQQSDCSSIDDEKIDQIVLTGLDLINYLEDHSKKLY